MVLLAGAVLPAAVRIDPTDSLVTGAAPVEEAATVAEEVARVTKRQIIPHTVIPAPVPMINPKFKATTTDMVPHRLKTLTIRVTPPLLAHTPPFQSSPVPTRITHPTKVRSGAMIEVFVSCMATPCCLDPTPHFARSRLFSFSSIESTDAQRISYEIQLRRHLSSPLFRVRAIFNRE